VSLEAAHEQRLAAGPREAFGAERLAVALTLAGLAAAAVLAWLSEGFYHDDDVSHFQLALEGWTSAKALLHWWARPGYNVPTMFVARAFWWAGGGDARFAMLGCRLFSAVQTAAVAYLSYRIARRLMGATFTAAIVPALVWIQPLAMLLAITTLTETPAALYLTLGVWLYLRGNRVWACVAISPAFVTRVELLALTPILAAAVIADVLRASGGRFLRAARTPWPWACAAALLWAPVAYVLAAAAAGLRAADSPLAMLTQEYGTHYGSGSWLHFLQYWPQAAGLGVLVLALAGAVRLGRRGWLIWSLVYGLVALHTVLFRFGLFETGGYARFLMPVSGLVGVLAAAGLTSVWRGRRRAPLLAVYLAAPAWVLLGAWALDRAMKINPAMLRDPAVAVAQIVLPLVVIVVLTAAAAILPVVIAAVVRLPGRRPARLGRWGAAAMLVLNVVHVAVQVRPLRLDRSSEHYVVCRALDHVAGSPYAGRGGLTQHTLILYLRQNTEPLHGNEAAIRTWRRARPGTVFFWDSKYCHKPHQPDSTRRLREELRRLGERIFKATDRGKSVEVFVRKDDGVATKGGR